MFRTSATRGKAMLIATFATILLLGAVYVTIVAETDEEVRLGFAGRDGFGTASSHGGFAGDLLDIVIDTVDAYETQVQSLEVLQPLAPLGPEVKTELLSAEAYVMPDGRYEVRVLVPPHQLVLEGSLREVVPADITDTLRGLEAEGWDLLDDVSGSIPAAPPGAVDEPFVFEVGDGNHTYATLLVHPAAAAVEVIVHPAGAFRGMHIVSTPWVVEVRDDTGALVELWVRNPVTAFYAGAAEEVVVQNVACKNGSCAPRGQVRSTCRDLGLCPESYRVSAAYESGPNPLPGMLLHLWANDTIHGGAGIEVLGERALLAAPAWHGNPFTEEGLYVQDDHGDRLAGVALRLPTSAQPAVGITVSGKVVPALAGGELAVHKDLSAWSINVRVGDETIGTDTVYPVLDMASALLVSTWSDADGDVKAASIAALRERGEIVRLVEDAAGAVLVQAEGLGIGATYPDAEIEGAVEGVLGFVTAGAAPLQEGLLRIVTRTEEEVMATVRIVEGAAGCELSTLGCIGVVIGPALAVAEGVEVPGADGVPDPLVLVGDVPVDGETIVLLVNGVLGTALGYVPGPGAPGTVCTPGLPGAPPVCTGEAPSVHGVLAVVAGILGAATGVVSAVVEDAGNGSIGLDGGGFGQILQVDDGGLRVAGLGVGVGEGGLFTVYGPDGAETCVRLGSSPGVPAWPSLEVGCDGLAGRTLRVEPGVEYEVEEGRLASLVVRDPTSGDAVFEYADDGVAVQVRVALRSIEQSMQLPSEAVTVMGNPLTSSSFAIRVAGQAVPLGSQFSEVKVLRQAYAEAQSVASGLPVGSEVGLLFRLVEAPEADVRASDGVAHLLGAQGGFEGADWLSGLRDNAFRVTAEVLRSTPERVDVVYEVGALPSYGASPGVTLPVSGVSEDGTVRTHEGAVPAAALAGRPEGAVLHFGLAWVERAGPVAAVLWDDHGGQGYRYSLDTVPPAVTLSAPASTEDAVFAVAWSSPGDAGSGLSTFRVQSALGTSPAEAAWADWIAARPAGDPAFADFNGVPGASYSFRAAACDAVGNCAPWSSPRTVQVLEAAPPRPAAPLVEVLAPLPGATLSGVSDLAWRVVYDGDATPVVNVAYQRAGTTVWVPIESGASGTTSWRTDVLVDGAYTLRFVVTDGTYSTTRSVSVLLSNGVVEPSLDAVRAAAAGSGRGASGADGPSSSGGDGASPSWLVPVLAVGAVLVVGGAAAGVVLGRRRRAL